MSKTGKQYIFLIAFILLVFVILFIFLKNRNILFKAQTQASNLIRPTYLSQPIPKIDKIKTIVNNPKFKELKYVKTFFEPLEPAVSGRANPFMPFVKLEE